METSDNLAILPERARTCVLVLFMIEDAVFFIITNLV